MFSGRENCCRRPPTERHVEHDLYCKKYVITFSLFYLLLYYIYTKELIRSREKSNQVYGKSEVLVYVQSVAYLVRKIPLTKMRVT